MMPRQQWSGSGLTCCLHNTTYYLRKLSKHNMWCAKRKKNHNILFFFSRSVKKTRLPEGSRGDLGIHMFFDGFHGDIGNSVFHLAGILRGGLGVNTHGDQKLAQNGVPFKDFFRDLISGIG